MDDLSTYTCKYCNKICKNKNSLAQHEIRCKSNPNRLESAFVKFNKERDRVWNKGLTKETNISIKRQGNAISQRWKKYGSPNKGKVMSDEQKEKISISRINFLKENPDKIPYLLNHSSKISYPEQYFIELFERENIDLQYHKQVGLYQLDFYNDDKKLYLEIDGEQHYQEKSIERDKKRTEKLKERGWNIIMRIRWAEWKTYSYDKRIEILKTIKTYLNTDKI